MASYRKNYLQIYFWQGLAFVLNFVAVFIVTPLISDQTEIYGVYSVCVSLNIFLQYADFGFLTAAKKYAAEAYIDENFDKERKYISTSMTIFSSICFLLMAVLFLFSFYPQIIISGIDADSNASVIASKLLLVSSFSVPVFVLNKYTQIIYSVRLLDFKIQRINIVGSLIRISSVPLVFFNNQYDIVGYYIFTQIITLSVAVFVLHKSKSLGYGLQSIRNICKFDTSIFNEVKPLALSGFVASLLFLLYYEMDSLILSVWLGAKAVAVYAIGRSIQSFVRSLFGIVFSPYSVRFNYYVGKNDINGLFGFYKRLVSLFSNLTFVPLFVLILFAHPFVMAWVGPEYNESVLVMQLLVACFLFNYFLSPSGSLLYSLNKVKQVYISSLLEPLVFYIGVILTIGKFGVVSVAVFKFVAALISFLYYAFIVSNMVLKKHAIIEILSLKRLVIPVLISLGLYYLSIGYLDIHEKSKVGLLLVILVMAVVILLTYAAIYVLDKHTRNDIKTLLINRKI